MARFSRVQTWLTMEEQGLVPLFYHASADTAKEIIGALAEGGARLVEFTNRGDRAFEVFRELASYVAERHPDVILGVGSVLDVATAGLYINLGAEFVVGSVLNPEVARLCNRRKIPYMPGCGSPSEISQAEELGVEICKVFPASEMGGPSFIKAVKGPCPWSKLMPTGGVSASYDNLKAWFDAGVTCVGMGSALVRKDLVAARDWEGLAALTRQCLAWVQQARG